MPLIVLRVQTAPHVMGVSVIRDPKLSDAEHGEALRRALRLVEYQIDTDQSAEQEATLPRNERPELFTDPDLLWLPLKRAHLAALQAGAIVRIDIPADEVEGTKDMAVMIRGPKEQW